MPKDNSFRWEFPRDSENIDTIVVLESEYGLNVHDDYAGRARGVCIPSNADGFAFIDAMRAALAAKIEAAAKEASVVQ